MGRRGGRRGRRTTRRVPRIPPPPSPTCAPPPVAYTTAFAGAACSARTAASTSAGGAPSLAAVAAVPMRRGAAAGRGGRAARAHMRGVERGGHVPACGHTRSPLSRASPPLAGMASRLAAIGPATAPAAARPRLLRAVTHDAPPAHDAPRHLPGAVWLPSSALKFDMLFGEVGGGED